MYKIVGRFDIRNNGKVTDSAGNVYAELVFFEHKHGSPVTKTVLYFLDKEGYCIPEFGTEKSIEDFLSFPKYSKLAVKQAYSIKRIA